MIRRLQDFLTGTNSVRGASVIMVVTLFASNLLGLVRDHLLAGKIPTDRLDTYYAAFRIPDLIFNVLILGAVSAAFIPTLSKYFHKDEDEAWHIANAMLTVSVAFLVLIIGVIICILPSVIPFVVPNFSPEKQHTTIQLAQLLMVQPIFFGVSYLFSSILNARKRFVVYAIAPIVYNVCIIIATYFFAAQFQVYAVIYGVIVGSFFHLLIQAITARAIGYRYHFVWDIHHPAIRKIVLLMIPRSIGLGGMQFVLLVYTAIASSLVAGSVAIYSLTDNIRTMPLAVFAISFATALFPTLSDAYAADDERTFSAYIVQGIRQIAFLNVPSAIGIFILRAQIIRLILGSGYFNWEATQLAASSLGLFAFGLVGEGFVQLFSRAFYARHDTKIPTAISLASNVVMIIGGYLFSKSFGVAGLALGFSIGISVQAILLYVLLRRDLPSLRASEAMLWGFAIKLGIALVALIIGTQFTKVVVVLLGADLTHVWAVLLQAGSAILIGSVCYFLTAYYLAIPELTSALNTIASRFRPEITPKKPI